MLSRLSLHTIYCAVSTIYFVSPGPVYTRSFHKQTTLARHQVSAKMLLFSRLQFSHLRCTVHCQLNVSRQIPLWQTKSISKFNTWIREGSKKSALKCVLWPNWGGGLTKTILNILSSNWLCDFKYIWNGNICKVWPFWATILKCQIGFVKIVICIC